MISDEAHNFYQNVLGSPKLILAPMVEQSELAFRMLLREFGSQLCYTPMWHAGIFVRDKKYRSEVIEDADLSDRPLLFQFCANDPDTFADACALAEPHCDGIDLNLGCPQMIAHRGHYGAFLMEEWDLVEKIIRRACEKVSKPITCKIRVYESIETTVEYAKRLEKAGAKIITVHGRRRDQRGPLTGVASWDHIKAVKENVSVPVFANGNIQYLSDAKKCLEYTKVDGIMSAEGALYNPAIFLGKQPPAWEMVDKYLEYADLYKPTLGTIRGHLFRMWHHCLCKYKDLRLGMGTARKVEDLIKVSNELKTRVIIDAENDKVAGLDSEEPGKLPYWRCQPYVRPKQKNAEKRPLEEDGAINNNEVEEEDQKDKSISKRKLLRKKHNEHGKGVFPKLPKEKWPLCLICKANPWGAKCSYKRCKICCKKESLTEVQDCPGHKIYCYTNLHNPRPQYVAKKLKTENEKKCEETNNKTSNIEDNGVDVEDNSGGVVVLPVVVPQQDGSTQLDVLEEGAT